MSNDETNDWLDLELTSHNEDREKSDAPTVRTRSGDGNSDRAGRTQDHHGVGLTSQEVASNDGC